MDTTFMNSENSKTSKPHVLILNFNNKFNNNNKFGISAPTWNSKFEFPDGLYLYQIFQIILSIF